MAKRGTTAKIDLVELERLSAMQCTDEEIGAWFGVTTRTIERRRKNARFAEVMERGKAKGRISVRRMQMKLLEPDPAEQAVLTAIRDLRARRCTLRGIAAELNARGLRTRRASAWRLEHVARILGRLKPMLNFR